MEHPLMDSKWCGYLPSPPDGLYQRQTEHVDCSSCLRCPPHPADVPELFTEANEHAMLDRSIKEFQQLARGINPRII